MLGFRGENGCTSSYKLTFVCLIINGDNLARLRVWILVARYSHLKSCKLNYTNCKITIESKIRCYLT